MARKRTHGRREYTPRIDAELDLHGCFAREATAILGAFLHEAEVKRFARVRIIVGKGIHSPYGPVLPDVVKATLNARGYRYTYAKLCEGGEGALEVVLSE